MNENEERFISVLGWTVCGLIAVAQFIMIFLKLLGVGTYSWLVAFLPLIVGGGASVLFLVIAVFIAIIAAGRLDD